jgi:L-seryl-tRNA(Ser) seleniumtransferase
MEKNDLLRLLPSVDQLLEQSGHLQSRWGASALTRATRTELARFRQHVLETGLVPTGTSGDLTPGPENPDRAALSALLLGNIEASLVADGRSSLRQLINLTGTVLHTNLGRAILPARALDAVVMAASAPTNLEYNIADGKRGDRDSHVESLICELTGAEAATVVNNNAAAVLLVLNTLASNAQVPVSRGELVEIGGSFRIPEVMQRANCTLVEVGATNRTHLADYQRAINPDTALLMKVHTSNFRVEGFTKAVEEAELADLAHRHKLPLVVDLGSGNLIDFQALGLPREPTAGRSIENGADIITFSGDKLLGGPQCGIIAGKKSLLDNIRKNPLKRALRLDKMTLAALAEVLRMYRNPESLAQELPTLKFLTRSAAELEEQAERLLPAFTQALPDDFAVTCAPCQSQIGSGALPVENIPSFGLCISATQDAQLRALSSALRQLPRPVVGRISSSTLWLDLRCLDCEGELAEQIPLLSEMLG